MLLLLGMAMAFTFAWLLSAGVTNSLAHPTGDTPEGTESSQSWQPSPTTTPSSPEQSSSKTGSGEQPPAVRYADAAVFEQAPRYQGGGFAGSGLLPDEVPIIARRGELVVPPERFVRE